MGEQDDGFDELLEDALWLRLMCRCDVCGNMLHLDSIDYLLDVDTTQWSGQAAREAERLGWRYQNDRLLCAACALLK